MKSTRSNRPAPMAAIENAARVVEQGASAPLMAGCGPPPPPLLAGCGIKEHPLLAGCGGDNVGARRLKSK